VRAKRTFSASVAEPVASGVMYWGSASASGLVSNTPMLAMAVLSVLTWKARSPPAATNVSSRTGVVVVVVVVVVEVVVAAVVVSVGVVVLVVFCAATRAVSRATTTAGCMAVIVAGRR